MNTLKRWYSSFLANRKFPDSTDSQHQEEFKRTREIIGSAVVFAIEVRDTSHQIFDHSTRVARMADRLAERMDLSEADRYTLTLAARLHEVGMFAVPEDLLNRREPLSPAELFEIRAQALISAEIARMVHPPRVAWLIEHQYADHRELARSRSDGERDLLLAGILRVADVSTAVIWPRPYQDPMSESYLTKVLLGGAGTRFHPEAVRTALEAELLH